MNKPEGCTPKSATTDDGSKAPASSDNPTVFDSEVQGIVETYGYKELCVSIGKDAKLKRTKQQLTKSHMNSVMRNAKVREYLKARGLTGERAIGKVLKAVLATFIHVAVTNRREDLIDHDAKASADLLDNKIISKSMKPGLVGNLVAGRPEFSSDKGVGQKLPQLRWDYLVAQSKMPLVITRHCLKVLAQIKRLPEGYLEDREVIDDANLAQVTESQVEPISHRRHLNQVIYLVKTALGKGMYKLYDLYKIDGTGRIHGVSRTSHQGPGGIRCLHSAPSRRTATLDNMKLFAYKLMSEYGIDYRDISSYLDRRCERLVKEGKSLNALGAMNEFLRAARTGDTDFLYEGDMNFSLGTIKALFTGCDTSLLALGMLGKPGRKCPDTWMTIAVKTAKIVSWMKHLTKNLWRKIVKKPGTPGGYGASPNTMGIAVLGLTGVRIDKKAITCLDDLYVTLCDKDGRVIPVHLRETMPIESILPLVKEARPKVLEAIIAQAAKDFPGLALTVGMLMDYAEEMAEEVIASMKDTLPCLDTFDSVVLPPAKRKLKAGEDRDITGPYGFRAIISDWKLAKDKKDTKRVRVQYKTRTRTMKYIKAYFNKSNLAIGPYIVFLLESASLIRLWERTRRKVAYQKAIHDALYIAIQDVRFMNSEHCNALCDVVEMIDMSQFDLVDSKGNVLIDLEARKVVLDRVRKEGNPWGIPSKQELDRQFPELEAYLNGVNPNTWQLAVPKEKSIVLFNDTAA